jgi:hypothetical protein
MNFGLGIWVVIIFSSHNLEITVNPSPFTFRENLR